MVGKLKSKKNMWNNKTPEQIYLESHPKATLKEWLDYQASENKKENDTEINRCRKCKEWYESKIGHYFLIDFNGCAKIAGILSKSNLSSDTYCFPNCYSIYSDNNSIKFKIFIERNRVINNLWLQNPYELNNDSKLKCKEISKEEFDTIVEKFYWAQENFDSLSELYKI